MPSKDEQQRRKALVNQVQQVQRAQAEAQLPLFKPDLKALFDHVDERLEAEGCDHTLRHTLAFVEAKQLPRESVVKWLNENGGYCDCEVIANVEEVWGEAVSRL